LLDHRRTLKNTARGLNLYHSQEILYNQGNLVSKVCLEPRTTDLPIPTEIKVKNFIIAENLVAFTKILKIKLCFSSRVFFTIFLFCELYQINALQENNLVQRKLNVSGALHWLPFKISLTTFFNEYE